MFHIDNYINPSLAAILCLLILAVGVLTLVFGIRAQDERHRRRQRIENLAEGEQRHVRRTALTVIDNEAE